MIKNASNHGHVRLTISPSNVKPLIKPTANNKTKSLPSLNDERMYHEGGNGEFSNNSWAPYDGSFPGQNPSNSMVKYLSTPRLDQPGHSSVYTDRPQSAHAFDTYRSQTHRPALITSQPYLPTDPWPRM